MNMPTMPCRAMPALSVWALDPLAETRADQQSDGFRKERSPADAMERCCLRFARKTSPPGIREGDSTGCFDAISQSWLGAPIPLGKALLETGLKAGFMEHGTLFPTEAGTPQGGIGSPV